MIFWVRNENCKPCLYYSCESLLSHNIDIADKLRAIIICFEASRRVCVVGVLIFSYPAQTQCYALLHAKNLWCDDILCTLNMAIRNCKVTRFLNRKIVYLYKRWHTGNLRIEYSYLNKSKLNYIYANKWLINGNDSD